MKKKSRQVYLNTRQIAFMQAQQSRKTFVGGRGSGKSTVKGHKDYARFNYLPRAKFFTAGLTYNQITTKTLPSAMEAWERLGLRECKPKMGGHYVVFRKPPDNWFKPYQPPRNYSNCISFINGYTIELLSADRPDTMRGGNYDGGDIDESALMKKDVIDKILMPTIRGNIRHFSHPFHQELCDYTSAPWLPSGQWVYETEELAKQYPEDYFYQEATAYDNIKVLGEKYIKSLQRSLSKLEFDVEVKNKRMAKIPNCFYPSFKEDKHCYYDSYRYDFNEEAGLWLSSLKDINADKELEVSYDFNAKFTSMIVGQENSEGLRFVDCFHVTDSDESDNNKVKAVTEKFLEKYRKHSRKEVLIYGDRNGNNRNAGSEKTFYEQIIDLFRAEGWIVSLMVQGLDPDHRLKYFVINEILAEKTERLPIIRINQNTCKPLILSIQNSPITPDWKKDKSSESKIIDQIYATHYSDCFDNIVYRKYASLFSSSELTASDFYILK